MNLQKIKFLIKQKKFKDALDLLLKIKKNNENSLELFFYLGRSYSELNKYDLAIKNYIKALKIKSESIACLLNLAIVYHNIGELDKARNNYLKIISLNKKCIQAYFGLYSLNNKFVTKEYFENLFSFSEDKNFSLNDKSLINFLLSKKEKQNKNLQKEIYYLKKYHDQNYQSNLNYNNQSQFYYDKIISNKFDKIKFLDDHKKNSLPNFYPIFIVGLPRSGSTLTESILTSTEQKLKTFGESNFFNVCILEQMSSKIFNKNFEEKNFNFQIDLKILYKSIYEKYGLNNFKDNYIFIDKSLENFFNIEIILKVFPNAKFIHTFRNLKDSFFSIFTSMLSELSWTHSIDSIDNYIFNYCNTLNFFKKKYPNKILDLNLENLIFDTESVSKNIFKFLGFKWDPNSLNFYLRKDLFSKTISATQIRKKIDKNNQSNYKNYYELIDDKQLKSEKFF